METNHSLQVNAVRLHWLPLTCIRVCLLQRLRDKKFVHGLVCCGVDLSALIPDLLGHEDARQTSRAGQRLEVRMLRCQFIQWNGRLPGSFSSFVIGILRSTTSIQRNKSRSVYPFRQEVLLLCSLSRQTPVKEHEFALFLVVFVDQVGHVIQALLQERVCTKAESFMIAAAEVVRSSCRQTANVLQTFVLSQFIKEGMNQV